MTEELDAMQIKKFDWELFSNEEFKLEICKEIFLAREQLEALCCMISNANLSDNLSEGLASSAFYLLRALALADPDFALDLQVISRKFCSMSVQRT